MIGPRNRKAAAKSARERELIRQTLLVHSREHPLSRPPTAKELLRLTGLRLRERRIQQHLQSLRIEAEIRELLHERLAIEDAQVVNAAAPALAVESAL